MTHAVFVAPFALDTTLKFVRAAASLDGVRLSVVGQEPAERLGADLRARLAAYRQVGDALNAGALTAAVAGLAERLGPVERLVGVLEQLQVPLAEARQRLGIAGMAVETAHNFRDKARMKTVLRQAGIPCARHRLAGGAGDAEAFAAEVGFPLVLKPPAGAGARSTYRVDDAAQLSEALTWVRPRPEHPVLVEEFLTGKEHSFDSVLLAGRPLWYSISHYLPTPLEVLRNPWIQWCVLLPRDIGQPEYEEPRRVGLAALAALGLETGMTHMEWFRRPDGSVAVSEVAARPPGAQITSLISWAHDLDFYRAWARLMILDRFEAPARRFAVGAAYLRGQGRGRIVAVRGLEEAQREVGGLVVEASLPRPGQAPVEGYEGEGYVIVRHPETRVVEQALATIISRIRVELG